MSIRHTVIVNPASGGGAGMRLMRRLPNLFKHNDLHGEFHLSHSMKHFKELICGSPRGENDRLVVCGGDGSVNMALQAFHRETDLRLALLPCGRGNDLARTLSIPRSTDRAVSLLTSGYECDMDVGYINGVPFATIATTGYDALVSIAASKITMVKGKLVYLVAALKELLRFEARHYTVEGENFRFDGPAMMVSFANSPFYGGGMKLSPASSIRDGLLDICIVKKMGKIELLRALSRVFSGTHIDLPQFITNPIRAARVTCAEPGPLCADGEVLGQMPADVTIRPSVLKIICGSMHGNQSQQGRVQAAK